MNQYLKVLALTILLIYTVNTQSATIDQQITDLRTQIADKIKQQETLMSQRVASITATSSKFNELKSIEAELLQARVAAETSYKAYFNEQTRCDGLKGVSVLDTQTSISGDAPCLKAPLGPESIDLAMKRFQVSSFDVDVYAAQQILD